MNYKRIDAVYRTQSSASLSAQQQKSDRSRTPATTYADSGGESLSALTSAQTASLAHGWKVLSRISSQTGNGDSHFGDAAPRGAVDVSSYSLSTITKVLHGAKKGVTDEITSYLIILSPKF